MYDGGVVIIAPHADDEIIGNYEVLETGHVTSVAVPDIKTAGEMEYCSLHYNFKIVMISEVLERAMFHKDILYFFPDPFQEYHPDHKYWGMEGYKLAMRNKQVIFYNTNMNAPYIREVTKWKDKRQLMDALYPDKMSLWEYDHKYFLFEGHHKFLYEWND